MGPKLYFCDQVFYHLGDYKEAMDYALKAEEYFDISNHSEYVDTLIGTIHFYVLDLNLASLDCLILTIFGFDLLFTFSYTAKCIDEYTRLRQQQFEKRNKEHEPISKELENIVERMFNRCFEDKEYKQVVFVLLERNGNFYY
jgi:26S proteasome regulatory subunit N2